MSKNPHYRLDGMILLFFLLVMLLGASSFMYRYYTVPACPAIAFTVSADTLEAGQMVMFTNQTSGVKEVQWDFGDNSALAHKFHAGHTYAHAGVYTLKLTINGACSEYRRLVVRPARPLINHALLPTFSAPGTIEINQLASFQCLTENARSYEWRFGESGRVDSRDKNPKYRFSTPGIKTVSLVINGDEKYIARQIIHVMPPEVPRVNRQQVRENRAAAAQAPAVHIPDAPDLFASYDSLLVAARVQPEERIKALSNDELVALVKSYAQGATKASQFKTSFCDRMESSLVEANGRLMRFQDFLSAIKGQNIRVREFRTIRSETGCVQQMIIRYRR